MRNGVSYLTDVAFPSHMYVENQSNSIWLKSKMSLIECAFYSPSTLHPFNWCEWIVSSFVRYRREFREFHIDTGIYYYYYFFHSKYSLFIIYWLVWLKSHIFAQRSKEREKTKLSSSSSSSKTIILSTFHHLFPDFLYSFLLPHETHFSLFTFHTKSESIYTFTVANLLIVCWNSDESITCAHSVPHTYTQPKQKKCNTRQYYSLAIFWFIDFWYGRVAIVFTFLPSMSLYLYQYQNFCINEFFIRNIYNFSILMTRYFLSSRMDKKKNKNEINVCWLYLIK